MYTWPEIKEYIEELLNNSNNDFDKETIDFIRHYIEYDEFEMAFEALLIEMINSKKYWHINKKKAKEIALVLKLDKEPIYDFDFWKKFESFITEGN